VDVWDVFGKRSKEDEFTLVGGVTAPDVEMALVLARETHFRHKEGVAYAVRRRGETQMHAGPYGSEELGGVTDRSYRRQEAYAGVGGRLRKLSKEFAEKGVRVDAPRPPAGRTRHAEAHSPAESNASDPAALTPEKLASEGTAG
jgi:1,2-phenylacetyl-CoA epoxidase PaaB subunit